MNDPRERAMLEGFETWKQKRNDSKGRQKSSDWLKGGFSLFAYEDQAYNDMINAIHATRNG